MYEAESASAPQCAVGRRSRALRTRSAAENPCAVSEHEKSGGSLRRFSKFSALRKPCAPRGFISLFPQLRGRWLRTWTFPAVPRPPLSLRRAAAASRMPPEALTFTAALTESLMRRTSSAVAPPVEKPVEVFTNFAPAASAARQAAIFSSSGQQAGLYDDLHDSAEARPRRRRVCRPRRLSGLRP